MRDRMPASAGDGEGGKEQGTGRRLLNGGYFTVEMSMVFPVVLFVMVLLLHFLFYLYGRCILSQDIYLLAFRGSSIREEKLGTDRESYVRGIADAQFGRKYFGNRLPTLTIEVSSEEVRVRGETEASHRAMSAYPMMPLGSWAHGAGAVSKILDPPAHIRRVDRLGDLAKGIYESAHN